MINTISAAALAHRSVINTICRQNATAPRKAEWFLEIIPT